MKPLHSLIILSAALVAACSPGAGRDDRPAVPRRHAYPRIVIPDSVYRHPDSLPLGLQIAGDAVAVVSRDDATGTWIDVDYPAYGASILYTLTPVSSATLDEVIDNRLQRIALNAGSTEVEVSEFIAGDGMTARVILSRAGTGTTPVQFLATDNRSIVVSGAAYLPLPDNSARDSLRPVIDMLRRDIVHALKNISR